MKTADEPMKTFQKKRRRTDPKEICSPRRTRSDVWSQNSAFKRIAKTIKGNQSLACELYETGNVDAMYLAGIVAYGSQMSKKQLDSWAKSASWHSVLPPYLLLRGAAARRMAAARKNHRVGSDP